jgi:hypothetical protein
MRISPLIFSKDPKLRISRHLLFWSVWVTYDTVFAALGWSKYPFAKAFVPSFFVELFSFPLDIAFCYTIIYFLIPRFLYRGRYIEMILVWLCFSLIYIACFREYNKNIPPLIYGFYGMPYKAHPGSFLWDFFYLFSQINMEGCMAAAIKLGKMWFIKEQESEVFNKEKKQISFAGHGGINRPQPVFLGRALDKVALFSKERPEIIPPMMQNIRSLFLYANYMNNRSKASLGKELEMVRLYIELEQQISSGETRVNARLPNVPASKKIAPNIILPLVEHGFLQLSVPQTSARFIDLETAIHESTFELDITWSKPADTSGLANTRDYSLHTINNYLKLVYPGSHVLKLTIKPAAISVHLQINLDRAINHL